MLPIGNTRLLLRAPSRVAALSKRPISAISDTALRRHALASCGAVKAGPARLSMVTQKTSYVTKTPNGFQQGIDTEAEKKTAEKKLTPHPEAVSMESSVRHVYEPSSPGKATPVQSGISDDLQTVKETFSLAKAPNEPYWLGLAGTLPYLGTSLSTVYLSWVLNTPWPAPSAFVNKLLISQETAQHLMATLEPIQLGYGAVIISFLGAVHWGMEYTEKVPDLARTRFRYGLGVMASIMAWPTLFLPVPFALTGQFAAFVALYFADARATVRGWAPAWYSTYRFALTAVVGVAIAISLIGRAKVGDASPRLSGLGEKFHERRGEEGYSEKWAELEEKEAEKQKKEAEKKKKEEEKKQKEEEKKQAEEDKRKDKSKSGDDSKKDKKDDSKGKESKEENKEGSEDKNDEKSQDKSKDKKSEDKSQEKSDEKSEGKESAEKKDE
ncbi:hypothetical protein F5Y08DRAFT_345331 [Xylaria arbuscula]|nr:hypothetical protein F5Y08DRAFT_345331 [Xylaria arbuscula]